MDIPISFDLARVLTGINTQTQKPGEIYLPKSLQQAVLPATILQQIAGGYKIAVPSLSNILQNSGNAEVEIQTTAKLDVGQNISLKIENFLPANNVKTPQVQAEVPQPQLNFTGKIVQTGTPNNTQNANIEVKGSVILPQNNSATTLQKPEFLNISEPSSNSLIGKNFTGKVENILQQNSLQNISLNPKTNEVGFKILNITLPQISLTGNIDIPEDDGVFILKQNTLSQNNSEQVLQGKNFSIKLPIALDLPQNSIIKLQLVQPQKAEVLMQNFPQNFDGVKQAITSSGSAFKEMFDVLSLLQNTTTAAAINQKIIPDVKNKNFSQQALMFLSKIASGNSAELLPDEVKNYFESIGKKDEILAKFESGVSSIRGLFKQDNADQPIAAGWNSFLVPVVNNNQLDYIAFHNQKKSKAEVKEGADVRFVIELQNSYFGEIQIDGLYKNKPKEKNVSLIFKTSNEVDDATKNELTNIFTTSAEALGLVGNISFKTAEVFDRPYREVDNHSSNLFS
jgi:hypothetical protein